MIRRKLKLPDRAGVLATKWRSTGPASLDCDDLANQAVHLLSSFRLVVTLQRGDPEHAHPQRREHQEYADSVY
jgi:hypothetical protein